MRKAASPSSLTLPCKGKLKPKQYLYCLKDNIENAKANYCYDAELLYGGLFSTNVFELGEAILPIIQEGLEEIKQEKLGTHSDLFGKTRR